MLCRLCGHNEFETLIDLGTSPLSNAYLTHEDLKQGEMWFPLHAKTCTKCTLTQLDEFERPKNIFNKDYVYFSSESKQFVDHARHFVEGIQREFEIDNVTEIACNDGYLLQHFDKDRVNVIGVEPSIACAEKAIEKGILTHKSFWSTQFADYFAGLHGKQDLIIGNNVLAHVPDLNDFIEGVRIALAPQGIATFEFPYLGALIKDLQFDTIYHEHFSYFSFGAVSRAFAKHNLNIFDVQALPYIHGGSLRIYATHMVNTKYNSACRGNSAVDKLMLYESKRDSSTSKIARRGFSRRVNEYKTNLRFLIQNKLYAGCKIVGYGAAAKGNTMLNYCGFDSDSMEYIVDTTPAKQGKYLPGSRIPIRHPDELENDFVDYIWVLPWNWQDEILKKLPKGIDCIVRDKVVRH